MQLTHVVRTGIGLGLAVLLALPLASVGGDTAIAADGMGPGKSVTVGVAHDGFTAGSSKVSFVPSSTYPGTMQIRRLSDNKCLATQGGANDSNEHGVQWTGCNNHSSKNWLVEPWSTGGTATEDDTSATRNTVGAEKSPSFVLRSWRYPQHCLFSRGEAFDGSSSDGQSGRTRGVTPNCSAAQTRSSDTMRFRVAEAATSTAEWDFLRSGMIAGAGALQARSTFKAYSGQNLWVRPTSITGEYVGDLIQARSDGYFLPEAVAVDPAKEAAILATSTVSAGCAGGMWWGIDNTQGRAPITQSVTTSKQSTDSFDWGLGIEISGEKEWKSESSGFKLGVKVNGQIHFSSATAKTDERTITMTVPEGLWGQAVVSSPAITTLGSWQSGAAFKRPWTFNGTSTVALKSSSGQPTTTIAGINSHEQKSCYATGAAALKPGTTVSVTLPEGRTAPVVGDTVGADITFIQPTGGAPLDVHYQWYAGERPIAGATRDSLVVSRDVVGERLSFRAFENGGSTRFESPSYGASQTAPVLAASVPRPMSTLLPGQGGEVIMDVELSEGLVGNPYTAVIEHPDIMTADTSLTTGAIPGLRYDEEAGVLTGTPTRVGTSVVVFTDRDGNTLRATVRIDAAETIFASEAAVNVRVGDPVTLPLILDSGSQTGFALAVVGTGDSVGVTSLPGLATTSVPGATVAYSLSGTPSAPVTADITITSFPSYPDAGDSREQSSTASIAIVGTAAYRFDDGARLELPAGTAVDTALADIVVPGDTMDLVGTLPAGLSYDPATGKLTGTPTAPGTETITLSPRGADEVRTLTLEVFGDPEISIERLTDAPTQRGVSPMLAGDDLAWEAFASHAVDFDATVRRVGETEPIPNVEIAAPSAGELEIDVTDAQAGEYEIVLTARGLAGTTQRVEAFSVAAAVTPEPTATEPTATEPAATADPVATPNPAVPVPGSALPSAPASAQPNGGDLASTGATIGAGLLLVIALGALISGAILRRVTRSRGMRA